MWLYVIFSWVDCISSEVWSDYVLCLVELIVFHLKCDVIDQLIEYTNIITDKCDSSFYLKYKCTQRIQIRVTNVS